MDLDEEIAKMREAMDLLKQADAGGEYGWAFSPDMKLRCFIFDRMADSDIADYILIAAMHKIEHWIKTGELPKPTASVTPFRKTES